MNEKRLLEAARGVAAADLVLKGGTVVNVFSGKTEKADLAIAQGIIVGLGDYRGHEEIDVSGRYLLPGLIDAHIHIESTMLMPHRLAEALIVHGTTALVADPHEIANVLGIDGIKFLIQAGRDLPVDFHFMAPSCVPATPLETSGADISIENLTELLENPNILGLAEVMNFPGAVAGAPDLLKKIALFKGRPIDGHAPLLSGPGLSAYISLGIRSDHECTTLEEAREKLARGMRIFIREGSQAKNLEDLLPVVDAYNSRRICFCADDRHPEDILEEGHLDHILRKSVTLGLDPIQAVSMATINPAETFGLADRGALSPGYRADVVVVDSLSGFKVQSVIKQGRLVVEKGRSIRNIKPVDIPAWAGPMNVAPVDRNTFRIPALGPKVRVIKVIENQILTDSFETDTPIENGRLVPDPARDLALLAVIERHQATGRKGIGLVQGFGLKQGALATTVAHDSHNIIVVGMDPVDMSEAVHTLIDMGGGLVVVSGGKVLARHPLPLAGLMSSASAKEAARQNNRIKLKARELGCIQKEPFMSLSFLALPVIPELKLTDMGLVDVSRFEFVDLFVR